jgi:hypothetical protein
MRARGVTLDELAAELGISQPQLANALAGRFGLSLFVSGNNGGLGRMTDRQFVTADEWALASDGIQWVLQHRRLKNGETSWRSVSCVRSTRDILARCMRERGVPAEDADRLLAALPPTFDEWLDGSTSWSGTSNAPPLVPTKVPLDQAETITENSGKTA